MLQFAAAVSVPGASASAIASISVTTRSGAAYWIMWPTPASTINLVFFAVFGYDAFADRVREATRGLGVAAVYDGVGATTFDGSLASLQVRGTLVVFGASSGPVEPIDPIAQSTP